MDRHGWAWPPEPSWAQQRINELLWQQEELERALFRCREQLNDVKNEIQELACELP
jgi:hypothetical protein